MPEKDKRVDAYIAGSAPFAKPILKHIRELVHKACPEVQETIKWGFAAFDYNGPFCSMAAFKQHCVFGFWKAALMKDPHKLFPEGVKNAMGHLGQIKSMADLPTDKIMIAYIKEAAQLNKDGIKLPSRAKAAKTELMVPAYFTAALNKNKKALKTYEGFSHSNKKEYVTWVTEAKTEETRSSRLITAIEWMAEGKIRNWKYVR